MVTSLCLLFQTIQTSFYNISIPAAPRNANHWISQINAKQAHCAPSFNTHFALNTELQIPTEFQCINIFR